MAKPRIAFIGIGNMGAPMAAHVSSVAGTLILFDARPEMAEEVAAKTGATVASSLAAAADSADMVITMLPNADVVREVVLGKGNALLPALSAGAIIIDMSSSFPPATRALGNELRERGIAFLDAPVSGGVKRAVSGTLSIMLGGDDAAALDKVEPVLTAMGTVYRTGGLGSGHALKALNNYVSAAGLAAAAEAVIVGRAFGLDPAVMIDVINQSTGKNNATENKFHQFILNENFNSGFALDLMAKDIRAADGLAKAMGLAPPGLSETAQRWSKADKALGKDADHTAYFRFIGRLMDEGG